MADENNVCSLRECIALWESQGVKNLDWLNKEDPAAKVEYVEIPDVIAMFDDLDVKIPGWHFVTTHGEFRFIVKDGYLYPETVYEEGRGCVNHRSRFYDLKYDIDGKLIFGQFDRNCFRTNFGFGFAHLTQDVKNNKISATDALKSWTMYANMYHDEVSYLFDEYHRRADFAEHIGLTQYIGKKSADALYDGFSEALSYLVQGDKYTTYIKELYMNPDLWESIGDISLDIKKDIFLELWDVPGAAGLLSKLAHCWDMPGWAMLETLMNTDEFPVRAIKEDKETILPYVTSALGLNTSPTSTQLPSFY